MKIVFKLLRANTLYAKGSKCCFGVNQVEYLGHFISGKGVSTDPRKVEVVMQWPTPTSLKQLRGFLGLAGYYRRFVKDFGKIAQPLTNCLKAGGGFH